MSPRRPTRRARTALALLVLGAAALCVGAWWLLRPRTLRVPRPALRAAPPPPELPASVVQLPVVADLRGLLDVLEREVPRTLDATGAWTPVADGRLGLKYRVERSPFSVRVDGAQLHAGFQARYAAEACVRLGAACPRVAGCGKGDAQPSFTLRLTTDLAWTPDWRLRATSRHALDFPTPCRVTLVRYDVTPHLERALAPPVAEAVRQLDARVPEVTDLRPHVARAWALLQEPIALGREGWLQLRPAGVVVSPPEGRGHSVSATAGVTVRPVVSVGARPEAGAAPLPPLRVGPAGEDAVRLALDARIPYAELDARLRAELRGRTLQLEGGRLHLEDVAVEGGADGALLRLRVTLRTGFLGLRRVRGDVYLTAHPRYDAASGALVLEDLEYSLETQEALAQLAERWGHASAREALQLRARFPVSDRLEALRAAAEAGLRRELAPGLRLEGRVEGLTPLGVYADAEGFVVRGLAEGRLALHVDTSELVRPRR